MIRIIDEPVFEMTRDEYMRLTAQYSQQFQTAHPEYTPTFEQWLAQLGQPRKPQGRMQP